MSVKLKIVSGLGSLEYYEDYVRAGADELFCGVMPFEWLESRGVLLPMNRREVLLYPTQISSMEDMKILARLSREDKVPVAVTVNSFCYRPQDYPVLLRFINELIDMGIDRFIISDTALLMKMPAGAKIHVSGEWGEDSADAMKWLMQFRPARVIFHRKVTIREMKACIAANPFLEYEAFMLNERCYYTGAYCSSLHCDEMPHICKLPYTVGGAEKAVGEADETRQSGSGGCGICAIDSLARVGVTHLKLVGRGARPEQMIKDIALLRRAVDMDGNRKQTLFPQGCGSACYYKEREL